MSDIEELKKAMDDAEEVSDDKYQAYLDASDAYDDANASFLEAQIAYRYKKSWMKNK